MKVREKPVAFVAGHVVDALREDLVHKHAFPASNRVSADDWVDCLELGTMVEGEPRIPVRRGLPSRRASSWKNAPE